MNDLIQELENEIGEDLMLGFLEDTLTISKDLQKLNWLLAFITVMVDQ